MFRGLDLEPFRTAAMFRGLDLDLYRTAAMFRGLDLDLYRTAAMFRGLDLIELQRCFAALQARGGVGLIALNAHGRQKDHLESEPHVALEGGRVLANHLVLQKLLSPHTGSTMEAARLICDRFENTCFRKLDGILVLNYFLAECAPRWSLSLRREQQFLPEGLETTAEHIPPRNNSRTVCLLPSGNMCSQFDRKSYVPTSTSTLFMWILVVEG
jgi:hypothetical protein